MFNINICAKPDGDAACDLIILRGNEIEPSLELSCLCRDIPVITPLYESDGFLCASLVTRERVITQRAITLNRAYAYKTSCELHSFFIGDVRCAIVVDADVYRPEIFRYLALNGTKLVICPRFVDERRFCEDSVIFGPWSNAQANNLFVVDVNNVDCSVICQCDLCEDKTGFIAKGRTDDFCAELPIERFFEGQRSFPIFQSLNSELYEKYFSGKN